ncbi:hypothetical protein N7448_006687 [Penicillium atrosanguineum]|uniref:Uncharacterized protein n=1 Tax=Penicillium atrosanguineum TaxID=1132637 RepID=A0A9W9L2T0_9EURO|nr:hypothetical protein N7448_006687 [Penicillium atrosanguineum]KAJ5137257.1 hypothetical protein N7526_003490 [Penicillium atrosanguineum]KAJ5308019.1 hypothetical protein N7476_008675 [Penicillium atrosanguineum]
MKSPLDITDEPRFYLQEQMQEHLRDHYLELTPDTKFVRWLRDNPRHPRNWPTNRKIYDTALICLLDLVITASSTAGAAAASQARHEYKVGHTFATFCFVTLFLLGQCVGTIVFPPWTESFGRKKLYIISSALSCACCIVIGTVNSLPVAIVMRVIAGLVSAVPGNIVGGSIEDLFNSQARVWAIYWWTVASNIGLIVGPIMSSHIVAYLNWRWVFYIYAIVMGIITGLLFFIRESRSSLLLTAEVEVLRRQIEGIPPALNHDHMPTMRTFMKEHLFRPAQLFCGEPIVFTISMIISVVMSLIYMFTEAMPIVYQSMGFTRPQASLMFLAIGLGTCLSAFTRMLDSQIINKRRRKGLPIRPEDKLVGLGIGAPILAISLWWFGWTIPPLIQSPSIPWIVPTVSLIFVGFSLTEIDTVLYGYISDSYLSYSASATAAVGFFRGLLSGVFPLFTKQMFHGLGSNFAMSILAGVATVFCIVPPLFLCYGERIRRRSRFAAYSWEIQSEMGKDDSDL